MNTTSGVSFNLREPLGKISKAVCRTNIIYEDNGICTAIVALSDGPEAFLPSSVPDLKLHVIREDSGGMHTHIHVHVYVQQASVT